MTIISIDIWYRTQDIMLPSSVTDGEGAIFLSTKL